jgi:fatty-acyl-CoA synthase
MAPDQLAVVDGGRRLTYSQADDQISRVAGGLQQGSGQAAPTVAVHLQNSLEYYLVYWAVIRLGGVIVPLNTWLRRAGLTGILRSVSPDVLVTTAAGDECVNVCRDVAPAARVVSLGAAGDGVLAWSDLQGEPAARLPLQADALAIIMHTSGTTAMPKGAMMRHSDLLFNVMTTLNAHQFGPRDVHLLVNPMFHCTALYSSLPSAAYTKTPVVIARSAQPAGLMELVEKEHITTFLSVPTVFRQLLAVPGLGAYDASSLRLMAYAGSPMPPDVIQGLKQRFPNVDLHNFFGLTETISMTHVLKGEEADERPESVGRLLAFVEARVLTGAGEWAAPGVVGELVFDRRNVIPGYFGQPGRLEESVKVIDGREWFCTGDLASVDDEGYFFIKGRKKDMIIVGGENVYAVEVEAFLQRHPLVVEVAVKGVPATGVLAHLGEQIHAFVVRKDKTLTDVALRKYCFENLASYQVPRKVVFVDALPRNPSGKVVKDRLGVDGKAEG